MDCSLIYLKIVPPITNNIYWVKHCHIFERFPLYLQEGIKNITDDMNMIYKDDIIVPLSYNTQNGCVVTPDKVGIIAVELYDRYDIMMKEYSDDSSIRIVFGDGKIEKTDVTDVHMLRSYDLVVKVGRLLDKHNYTGIYMI